MQFNDDFDGGQKTVETDTSDLRAQTRCDHKIARCGRYSFLTDAEIKEILSREED